MLFQKKIIFLLLPITLAFLSCNAQNKKQKWIEDIDFVKNELPRRRKDFIKLIDSSEFVNSIDKLKANLDSLEDYEILFELQQIIAKLKVAHTKLHFPNTKFLSRLPVEFEIFDDGIYITNTKNGLKKYIGQQVIAINNIPVDSVDLLLSRLISYENNYWLKNKLPKLI